MNLIDLLPQGFVTNGTVDYTGVIQKALISNREIVFPPFPILINEKGITIPSDTKIRFLDKIIMSPSANKGYELIKIKDAKNITLENLFLIGDRYTHTRTGGDAGLGLGIRGSENITLINPVIEEMWGDGIYIGVSNGVGNKNITIESPQLVKNRRNGMSVISVDGLTINAPYLAFNDGTAPMGGIDFEPNKPGEEIKNVVLNDVRTEGNPGAAIYLDFGNLMGGGQKVVDVTINGFSDTKSNIGLKVMSRVQDGSGSTIKGDVIVKNMRLVGTTKPIQTILYGKDDVHLTLDNPSVITADGKVITPLGIKDYLAPFINRGANYEIIVPKPALEFPLYINCGGSADYESINGKKYITDSYFTDGNIFGSKTAIFDTEDAILFQTERNGNFSYKIPAPKGIYSIGLKFAEIYHKAEAKRIFNVSINTELVLNQLDLFKLCGFSNAIEFVKDIAVVDGFINIDFVSVINKAKISAICIIKK